MGNERKLTRNEMRLGVKRRKDREVEEKVWEVK